MLIIFLVCGTGISAPLRSEQAAQVDMFSYLKSQRIQNFKTLGKHLSDGFRKLNEAKTKDWRDICVWKICSRPLKNLHRKNESKQKIDYTRTGILNYMSTGDAFMFRVLNLNIK